MKSAGSVEPTRQPRCGVIAWVTARRETALHIEEPSQIFWCATVTILGGCAAWRTTRYRPTPLSLGSRRTAFTELAHTIEFKKGIRDGATENDEDSSG